jgi:crossover junction endodeoxyribonuclease RuvC
MKSETYLGLDLSMSSSGIAVVNIRDKKPDLVVATRVKTKPSESHGWRLYAIARKLREVHEDLGPFKAIVREKGFSRFAAATQAIFKVVGVTDFLFRDYDISEVTPTTVKKIIAGNGKASKEQVEEGVRRILGLDDDYKFESDDASDAVGVILTHMIKEGLIEWDS